MQLINEKERKRRRITRFMRYFPVICLLLILFDLTTTVWFSIVRMDAGARDLISKTENQISQYIHSVWNLGNAIAQSESTKNTSVSLRERAQALIPFVDAYDLFMLGITDEKGHLGSTLQRNQITSRKMLDDRGIGNLSSRPAFQEVMATGKAVLTDTYLAGADAKTKIYTIWIPYYNEGKIAGTVTVSIKFDFINNIIANTYVADDYYLTLLDSRDVISANAIQSLIDSPLEYAYEQSKWTSISLDRLKSQLDSGETGSYWGINNGRLEYVTYTPVSGTKWKLIMRTDFFGSFKNAFYSLGIKLAVYILIFLLFFIKRNRDIFARERLYDMMTANVDEVFFIYDTGKKKLTYVSGNAGRMLGISAEEIIKKPEILKNHSVSYPFGEEGVAGWSGGSFEGEFRNPETGAVHPMKLRVYNARENDSQWKILVLTDEKEERQKQKLLTEAMNAAEKANKAKSAFLTNMSHDMRTPMNAIIGMTAIAAANIDNREKVLDCLSKITISNNHLMKLINDILDMGKIESGKVSLNSEPFSIPDMCRGLIDMVRPQLTAKNMTLYTETNGVIHENAVGDILRLNQVFINIMSNAVKFTGEKGTIKISVSELESGKSGYSLYRFSFTDSGMGIDPEFLPRLFNPFERVESSSISKIDGSGLGLAITKQLVNLMDGTISVMSKRGEGSSFVVTLPLQNIKNEETENTGKSLEGARVMTVGKKEAAESICRNIAENGGRCHCAETAAEAVENTAAAEKEGRPYDAVIFDIGTNVKKDLEDAVFFKKSAGPDAPLTVLSVFDITDACQEAAKSGFTVFLKKPVFGSDIRAILGKKQKNAETETKADAKDEKAELGGYRALLVEDNELNMEIAKEFLSLLGVETDSAWNGKEAVEKFAASPESHYDVIITDIQMPVMDGYETAKTIRGLKRPDAAAIPVIAMTANVFSEDIKKAREYGMNDYIAKPVDIQKIAETLSRWLNGRCG